MLHHALSPLGGIAGRFCRNLLVELAKNPAVQIDFVSISDAHHYTSESFGSTVATHRLNVYKTKSNRFTPDELFEYQAKSYIFILRTARNITYDLVHALGAFPEGYTAYSFKTRIPYMISLLPWDAAVQKNMMAPAPRAMKSFERGLVRSAVRVFRHRRNPNPKQIALDYLKAYSE